MGQTRMTLLEQEQRELNFHTSIQTVFFKQVKLQTTTDINIVFDDLTGLLVVHCRQRLML